MIFQYMIRAVLADPAGNVLPLQIHDLKACVRVVLRFPVRTFRRHPILPVYRHCAVVKSRNIPENLGGQGARLRDMLPRQKHRKSIRDHRQLSSPAFLRFHGIGIAHAPYAGLRFIQSDMIADATLLSHHAGLIRRIPVIRQNLFDRIAALKSRHPDQDIRIRCRAPHIRLHLLPFPVWQVEYISVFHDKPGGLFLRYPFLHDRQGYCLLRRLHISGIISRKGSPIFRCRQLTPLPVNLLIVPVHQNIFHSVFAPIG